MTAPDIATSILALLVVLGAASLVYEIVKQWPINRRYLIRNMRRNRK